MARFPHSSHEIWRLGSSLSFHVPGYSCLQGPWAEGRVGTTKCLATIPIAVETTWRVPSCSDGKQTPPCQGECYQGYYPRVSTTVLQYMATDDPGGQIHREALSADYAIQGEGKASSLNLLDARQTVFWQVA